MIKEEIILKFNSAFRDFSPVQIASANYALSWKKECRELFDSAGNDRELFKEAVRWCGKTGGVIRTVSLKEFDIFVDWLFDNRIRIKEGLFDLSEKPKGLSKKPTSWISKICHIMNPHRYPIIYDSYVRTVLRLNNVYEFIVIMDALTESCSKLLDDRIYYQEACLWASNI